MAIEDLNDAIGELVAEGTALPCTPPYAVGASALVGRDGTVVAKVNAAGRLVYGDGSSPGRKRIPIATRCLNLRGAVNDFGAAGLSNGTTDLSETSRVRFVATADCDGITLLFANGAADFPNPDAVTYQCSIEDSIGQIYPAFFNGALTVTITNPVVSGGHYTGRAAVAETDKVGISFKKGDIFWIRTCVTVEAGKKWVCNFYTLDDYAEVNANRVLGGGSLAWISGRAHPGPAAIFGNVDAATRCLAIIGDSHFVHNNASYIGDNIILNLMGADFGKNDAHAFMAMGSETAQSFAANYGRPVRGLLLPGCTGAVISYGTNDIAGGATLAQCQERILGVCSALVAYGIPRRTVCVLYPCTTDAGGLTPVGTEAIRVGYNNWLRAGAPVDAATLVAVSIGTLGALLMGVGAHPITGLLRFDLAAETSVNSGRWVAGYTDEGIHASAASWPALQSLIDLEALF